MSADLFWMPKPHPNSSDFDRRGYFAGYSDGFHGYRFGAGDDGAFGAFSTYRPAYNQGADDARKKRDSAAQVEAMNSGWNL
jgi:hypothetical protein